MESRIKLLGHPIHPMLVTFPIGLLATSIVFDALAIVLGSATFGTVAFWCITVGLLMGLLAALFGLIDWLAIRSATRAKRIGLWHGLGNLALVILFAVSWLLRLGTPSYEVTGVGFVLELVGGGIALVTAWLGGELVYRLGIGVDELAAPDAPSSLAGSVPSASESGPGARRSGRDAGRPARAG